MKEAEVLGQRLREAREAKELSLQDAERLTRIREKFLDSLERGDYSGMTSVQARGFLRNYARALNVDLDLLMEQIAVPDERRGRRRKESGSTPKRRTSEMRRAPESANSPARDRAQPRGWFKRLVVMIMILAILAIVGLAALQIYSTLSDDTGDAARTEALATSSPTGESPGSPDSASPPTSDSASENGTTDDGSSEPLPNDSGLESGLPETSTAAPGENTSPEPAYTPPELIGNNVTVVIRFTQRTWIRVMVDGEVQQEGVAGPGDEWRFQGSASVGIRAENAAALDLTVNNQPQGTLGERGQLFEIVYTLDGVYVPTPEPPTAVALDVTASPTVTLRPTNTFPPPTIMISQTATLTLTATTTKTATPTLTSTVPPSDTPAVTATNTASPDPAALLLNSPTPAAGSQSDGESLGLDPGDSPFIAPSATSPGLDSSDPGGPQPPSTTPVPATSTGVVQSNTPAPTQTPTQAPTATNGPTSTPTASPTVTPTLTATPSPTRTPTLTPTITPSPTRTPTQTPSPTLTPSLTMTPTNTPFLPPRITRTPSPVPKMR